MVSLTLFAGASLQSECGPLSGPPAQRRRLALLALLASSHTRARPRESVAACLWPEHDGGHARNLLSQAVYVLRRTLGEEAIVSTGEELRLNPEVVACDVVRFEEALAAGELAKAVALYSGPFLDGVFLSNAPEFERWVDGERDRYRRAYCAALASLAESATSSGDFAAAVEWWRRLSFEEPYNSRVALRVMEALDATGDRAGALKHARVHATLLQQEFGAAPEAELEALAERLRRPQPAAIAGARNGGALIREAEARAAVPASSPASDLPDGSAPSERLVPSPPVQRGRSVRPPWNRATLPAAALVCLLVAYVTGWLVVKTPLGPSATAAAAARPGKAIAVLPCANLSGDPAEDYFSDGLAAELTGVLSRVRSLQVVARTSAFAFRGRSQDVREIGRTLGVASVLECSVRREGERVRVTAQLVDAANGLQRWANTYERVGTDVFAIQIDLALQIADALQGEISPAERVRIARPPTTSRQAHEMYLKGRHFWNQRTYDGFERAAGYFEQAIRTDPGYAAAHASLGIVYVLQSINGYLDPAIGGSRAKRAALTALGLDPELAEAHVALGGYLHLFEWDSKGAERAFQRAIELDPGDSYARHAYAVFLSAMDRGDEALAQRRKATELDPLDPHMNSQLGSALARAGRTDEARIYLHSAIELDPTYWQAQVRMGDFHLASGNFGEALGAHRRAMDLAGEGASAPRAHLAHALAIAGREEAARASLVELQADAARTGIYPPGVAKVFVALNDVDGGIEWLERSFRQRHPQLRFLGRNGDSRLTDDPRYLDLLRRIRLPY